ncbi:hypothetical protein ACFQ3R_01240 [Mesonia ostreae]|uniref:Uncharacterized protein n=1 Tax=Mesonia ostreae TaxID=861110 RepID=A0ABU2KHW8_9FLAO|nr:hypothetical protein [Mesonia ostreae]MDT0294306.1 hypothetical protein [Mesonia ostreae]
MAQDPKKNQNNEEYILKDNAKTKIGAGIIIVFLIVLILGVILSGLYFEWF